MTREGWVLELFRTEDNGFGTGTGLTGHWQASSQDLISAGADEKEPFPCPPAPTARLESPRSAKRSLPCGNGIQGRKKNVKAQVRRAVLFRASKDRATREWTPRTDGAARGFANHGTGRFASTTTEALELGKCPRLLIGGESAGSAGESGEVRLRGLDRTVIACLISRFMECRHSRPEGWVPFSLESSTGTILLEEF